MAHLSAVTPGTAGGLCHMLAELWNDEFERCIGPAMQLAAGYPIDAQTANSMEREKRR